MSDRRIGWISFGFLEKYDVPNKVVEVMIRARRGDQVDIKTLEAGWVFRCKFKKTC